MYTQEGYGAEDNYDIVIGPVADDNVHSVVARFENGEYELEEALKRLKVEQLSDQILFYTENALQYIHFKEWIKEVLPKCVSYDKIIV